MYLCNIFRKSNNSMKQAIRIFILTLVLVIASANTCEVVASPETKKYADELRFISITEQETPQAVLNDSSFGYRVCSSRPQRLSPTAHSKTPPTNGHFWSRLAIQNFNSLTIGTLPGATTTVSVSSVYGTSWFIVLRHIVR